MLIDGEYLSHLRFADDIIIFTRNIAELHEMLQELNQASLEVGLSMNFKKTKIMCNKHAEDTNRKITIDNNEIEEVDHYIYLERKMQPARGRFARSDLDRQMASTFPCPLESGPSSRFWGQPATGTRRMADTTHTESGRR